MDRLTFDGNFCDIARCDIGGFNMRCVEECSMKQVWDRLKAYEETGLTPDDIKGHFSDDTALNMAAQIIGTTVDHLREMQFRNNLIGKTVYCIRARIIRDVRPGKSKKYDFSIVGGTDLNRWKEDCYVSEKVCTKSDLMRLGETIFLTREDAEAAIGGGQE